MVIHGTDTMAFAASVLSFMLENLQKPVILTGAQVTRPQSQRPPEATEPGRGQPWASSSEAVWHRPCCVLLARVCRCFKWGPA